VATFEKSGGLVTARFVAEAPNFKDRFVTAGGWRLHVRSGGEPDASPIVLIHGMVVSGRYFAPLAERLASRFRVVIPDLPGHGRSIKPVKALDIPMLASALSQLLDATGLERPDLLANSYGCQVIIELAARLPERVGRLVLVGPTGDPTAQGVLRQYGRWLRNIPGERPAQLPVLFLDCRDVGIRRTIEMFQHMRRHDMASLLPSVTAPTLVVRGGNDPIAPQRWAETVAGRLPSGRLAVIHGAAHAVNFNSPRQLAQVVQAFLNEESRLNKG
jgi:2-hydroxy-6-oxonona-2,4-dienedioate hydrolase